MDFKKVLGASMLALAAMSGFAKNGYKIEVNFKQDVQDEYIYLAHYYAKPLPTIYKTDSAKVINKRTAVLQSKDSVLGGIYMILFDKRAKFAEMVLNNGDNFSISIDTVDMPLNVGFKGSEENARYADYEKFLVNYGKKQQSYTAELKNAKNAADTQAIRNKASKEAKQLIAYRKDYAAKYPGTYLADVFNALWTPEVPEGTHYLPGTKTVDSNFAYTYYKTHYWDKFNFKNQRLMNSPVYDAKLDEYFNRLVFPVPDSVNAESDTLLAKVRKQPEFFKYSLHWLANNAEKSKVMGMDEVFVHLVEQYYMRGDAFWLDSASLAKYEDRAKKIAPNVIGNIAPDLQLQDAFTLQDNSLLKFGAPYTLLVFWSKDCSHCTTEVPKVDSVYRAVLKNKGVKVYAISTEGDLNDIQKAIDKLGIRNWNNVVDAHNNTDYRSKYDVYSTPRIYLLDENKKIIGKGLDHTNIEDVLLFNEKRKNKGKAGS
ncbi:MAG: DUF5106 domain-containing protein [Edaphocola sp.]